MPRKKFSKKAEVPPSGNLKASFVCVPENLDSAIFIEATLRKF